MILCIGEAVIDMFQKQAPGYGDVFLPLPGGCSYNTSLAIGNLGAGAAFIGRISKNFFGEMQAQRLRSYNVKDSFLVRCDQNPILAFIKTEEGKQPQYAFYEEGTADRLLSSYELLDLPPETTCIVFGSVSMCMEPIATTIETFLAKTCALPVSKKPVIAFDPNIRPFMIKDRNAYIERFKKWINLSTIIKISSEDLEFIFPDTEPEDALQKILGFNDSGGQLSGAKLAIVTLGPDGATSLLRRDDKSVTRARAEGVKIPKTGDTVGAGDTFHGAFLAWLELRGKLSHNAIAGLSGEDLHNALCFANRAASIVCEKYGAQPPSLKEIEDITF